MICETCKQEKVCGPFGIDGAPICRACATASPEAKQMALDQIMAHAQAAMSGDENSEFPRLAAMRVMPDSPELFNQLQATALKVKKDVRVVGQPHNCCDLAPEVMIAFDVELPGGAEATAQISLPLEALVCAVNICIDEVAGTPEEQPQGAVVH